MQVTTPDKQYARLLGVDVLMTDHISCSGDTGSIIECDRDGLRSPVVTPDDVLQTDDEPEGDPVSAPTPFPATDADAIPDTGSGPVSTDEHSEGYGVPPYDSPSAT